MTNSGGAGVPSFSFGPQLPSNSTTSQGSDSISLEARRLFLKSLESNSEQEVRRVLNKYGTVLLNCALMMNDVGSQYTAMHVLARGGETRHLSMARLLYSLGAKPDAFSQDGGTPLHFAALSGRLDFIRMLTKEMGVNIDCCDNSCSAGTPLFAVASSVPNKLASVKLASVKLLQELGADVNFKFGNRTVLSAAVENGTVKMVKLLV